MSSPSFLPALPIITMHFHLPLLLCALLSIPLCEAATPEQWRTRSIYQVLTDRFAVANGSSTRPCDTGARQYCGGSYRGIVEQLDYIQGMGFTAVGNPCCCCCWRLGVSAS